MKTTTSIKIPLVEGQTIYTVLNNGNLGEECTIKRIESNECGIYIYANGKEDGLQRRFILATYQFGGKHFGKNAFVTKEQAEKYINWLKGDIEYENKKKARSLERVKRLLSKLRKTVN